MIREANRVGRPDRRQRLVVEERRDEPLRAVVRHEDVPAAVDDEGGIRLLLPQDELEGAAHLAHLRGGERRLPVHRGVAGRGESSFRARGGTSSTRASSRTMSRLGWARPVSMKLRWRVEIPLPPRARAGSRRRRSRHWRRSWPNAPPLATDVRFGGRPTRGMPRVYPLPGAPYITWRVTNARRSSKSCCASYSSHV